MKPGWCAIKSLNKKNRFWSLSIKKKRNVWGSSKIKQGDEKISDNKDDIRNPSEKIGGDIQISSTNKTGDTQLTPRNKVKERKPTARSTVEDQITP